MRVTFDRAFSLRLWLLLFLVWVQVNEANAASRQRYSIQAGTQVKLARGGASKIPATCIDPTRRPAFRTDTYSGAVGLRLQRAGASGEHVALSDAIARGWVEVVGVGSSRALELRTKEGLPAGEWSVVADQTAVLGQTVEGVNEAVKMMKTPLGRFYRTLQEAESEVLNLGEQAREIYEKEARSLEKKARGILEDVSNPEIAAKQIKELEASLRELAKNPAERSFRVTEELLEPTRRRELAELLRLSQEHLGALLRKNSDKALGEYIRLNRIARIESKYWGFDLKTVSQRQSVILYEKVAEGAKLQKRLDARIFERSTRFIAPKSWFYRRKVNPMPPRFVLALPRTIEEAKVLFPEQNPLAALSAADKLREALARSKANVTTVTSAAELERVLAREDARKFHHIVIANNLEASALGKSRTGLEFNAMLNSSNEAGVQLDILACNSFRPETGTFGTIGKLELGPLAESLERLAQYKDHGIGVLEYLPLVYGFVVRRDTGALTRTVVGVAIAGAGSAGVVIYVARPSNQEPDGDKDIQGQREEAKR